ncbi:phage tail tape measure protein [Sporanaerobacter acetigenes]|uniref:phage tail tape measure protein n=1 Tax=Sporanaerobacter acetigenes TaxID=165813 RepID=UPI0033274337
MAKEREVNIIIDAKNKAKGAFIEVKKDLKSLGDESKKGLGKFSDSFAKADKIIYSFADRMKWMDKIAKRTFQGTAAAAGIYVGATLKDFAQLNDGISKVNTLYDQTAESQKKMYQDSIQMFKMIPTDFEKITQGIYDTISAGADPEYATMMGRKFGMAGVAGDADMAVVTKAAMGTMNAYKAEVKDLNRILDLQFMTVKKGITSYDELASSLGTGVLASAKSAGITMEELYGSIAMITKNAIPAAIATTSLNQMFNKFTDTKVIKEFKAFGVEIQDANKNTRPLIEIFKDLNYQFDKRKMTSEQRKGFLKELVGSEQAARAIAPLLGDMKEFESILNSMEKSSGSMGDAFEDRLDNIKTQAQLLWNNLKTMGLEQVMTLEPFIKALTGPMLKKQKLEFEVMDLEDAIKLDPKKEKIYQQRIDEIKFDLEDLDLTPVEEFRDALAESVVELEKINPPLARFLDTIGNFALNFVGEEGAENRDKAGNVAKTALGVYGFKKAVDVIGWFNKNFKWIKGLSKKDKKIDSGDSSETLVKTLQTQTMNVNANIVNVYGKNINNIGKGTPGGAVGPNGVHPIPPVVPLPPIKQQQLPSGPKPMQLPTSEKPWELPKADWKNIVEIYGYPKNLTTGAYIPKGYEVGGDKYNQFKDKLLKSGGDKNSNSFEKQLLGELKKDKNIESNIDLKNQIKVDSPNVGVTVLLDGKSIPIQRVTITNEDIEKMEERKIRRHGRTMFGY